MIPGTVIELGGKRYVLPPMNLEVLELYEDFFKRAQDGGGNDNAFEVLPVIADVVYRCLTLNYPDIDLAYIKRYVNLGNMQELFAVVVRTSGLTSDAGEQMPADGPTGTTS